MKHILRGLHERVSSWLLGFENYFLGEAVALRKDSRFLEVKLNGHSLMKSFTVFLEQGEHEGEKNRLLCEEQELPPIIAVTPPWETGDAFHIAKEWRPLLFLLRPDCIERIAPMIESLMASTGPGPALLVLFYVSQISSLKESLSSISDLRKHHYDGAFERLVKEVKRIVIEHDLKVLVIDHPQLLGQKNSALLGRTFLETQ